MSGGFVASVGRFARTGLAAIGLATVTSVVGATILYKTRLKHKLPFQYDLTLPEEGFVLEIDMEDISLIEKQSGGLQAVLSKRLPKLELQHVVKALKAAGEDARVKGLFGVVGTLGGEAGLAQIQELRQAILAFRHKAGNRAATVAYADTFGEGGAYGTAPYYLASAFEHVYMMPCGLLSFTGLAASQPFARGLLDRLKIRPFVFQREEYKSALSFVTGTGFTDAERRSTTSLLQDLSEQIVADVAAGRRLTSQTVQAAVDCAPHMADKAVELQLIDGQLYRDQAVKMVARLHALKQGPAPIAAQVKEAAGKPLQETLENGRQSSSEHEEAGEGQQPGLRWVQHDEKQREAGRALLEMPDEQATQKLRRVSLQRYLRVIEAQQAQRQKHKALNSLEQAARDLQEVMKEGEAEKLELEDVQERARSIVAGLQVPVVAVLTLTGNIVLGRGNQGTAPVAGRGTQIASRPVIKALERVAATPAIKAVVLRVDSPGGSAAASDAIHREITRLQSMGKKVVVSMGNMAASGGYFISCPANKIVAQPATLTGSIGVISGKIVLGEFLQESLNINMETIKTGKNADGASPFTGFTKEQEEQVNEMVDGVYSTFLQRVSSGRGMPVDAVRELAKGRVWTGQQALVHGLVDALGGLDDAIRLAKKEACLPLQEDAVLVIDVYPEPRSTVGRLLDFFRGQGSSTPAATLQAVVATFLGLQGLHQLPVEPTLDALQQGCQLNPESQLAMGPQLLSVQAKRLMEGLKF